MNFSDDSTATTGFIKPFSILQQMLLQRAVSHHRCGSTCRTHSKFIQWDQRMSPINLTVDTKFIIIIIISSMCAAS